MIKKLFLAIAIATFSTGVFAQQIEDVTLTVSGDGATKKEATEVALRSAIEQAFGVFVSANTTILDDELVKDEIATVSSGNIKKYEEIATAILPNGNTTVTLKTIVSVSKLISYAQSKGSSAEFAGATFGMNMKLKELNKANEEKAIANMVSQLEALMPVMFDYKLKVGEPVVSRRGGYDIPARVSVIPNDNTKLSLDLLLNTLSSVALSNEEEMDYKNVKLKTYELKLGDEGARLAKDFDLSELSKKGNISKRAYLLYEKPTGSYYLSAILRSEISQKLIENFFNTKIFDAISDFKIIDNLDGISTIESLSTSSGAYLSATGTKLTGEVTGLISFFGLSPIPGIFNASYVKGVCIPFLSVGIPLSKAQKATDKKEEAARKRGGDYFKKAVEEKGKNMEEILKNAIMSNSNDAISLLRSYGDGESSSLEYAVYLEFHIPGDDIMKYNKFEITHK